MVGRDRLETPEAQRRHVARKAAAPVGYSSVYAARAGEKARAEAAAILRALVEAHGESIPMRWDTDELRAVARVNGEAISRGRLRYFEAEGWARLVPTGKGRARLDVDPEAIPEA